MLGSVRSCRVAILIKAIPRASKKYGETVCCAGATDSGEWRRLYPVRFRQLAGEGQFSRWDIVSFNYRRPRDDVRYESCHVFEDTILVEGEVPPNRRAEFLDRLLVGSARIAASKRQSLALIRPKNVRFIFKKKKPAAIDAEKALFVKAGRQTSFLDADLEALDPVPYAFAFRFEDDDGQHTYQCGDWETQATFWKWKRTYGEQRALQDLSARYNDEYPKKGLAFALGNVLKRPHTWQLLGVIRADDKFQTSFSF